MMMLKWMNNLAKSKIISNFASQKPKSNQGRLRMHRECFEPDPLCDGKYCNIFSNTYFKNEEI